MEESRKKPIMVIATVVCLALAAVITYSRYSGSAGTIDSIPDSEMIWVKCRNKDCGEEYQMGLKAYYKDIMANANPIAPSAPALICKKCGEPSVYRAEKCEKCGKVFFWASVPNDFPDRCSYCGYSKTETSRKQRTGAR